MGRITERIVAVLVGLFLLVYVGYQGYQYYNKPITTETVYEYSVSRSVQGRGIAIRDELVLDESVRGVENYLYEDATRISIGQTVAEFYRTDAGDKNIKRIRELEEEIRLLREAQDPTVANIGNTEIYNRDIKDQVGQLAVMASAGKFQGVADIKRSLLTLVNKKQISTQKVTDYGDRIAALEGELRELRRSSSGETIAEVRAPVSGYFCSGVDGYENRVLLDNVGAYTLTDYIKMIEANPPAGIGGKVGKLVLNQNWYFAAAVPKDEIEWVKVGRNARLQFDQLPDTVPGALIQILDHKDNDTAILLFRCELVTEDTINLRVSGVTVHFEQLTGLRINAAELRFNQENERGVYILDEKNMVRFRKVDPIYEDPSYILSETYYVNSLDKEHVKLFDQVIVKGIELYDGKPIQDS